MRELHDRVAMWQTYVQTTESVSDRAEAINRYMALVQIAIFSSYFIVSELSDWVSMTIGGCGSIVGIFWWATIYGYMQVHRAKLQVIADMEQVLPVNPITQESAMMKKASGLQVQDATSWKSFFSGVQMMAAAVVTGIHLIAMTWFGWLYVLPDIYRLYNLNEQGQSDLQLWMSAFASVIALVGWGLVRKFEHRATRSAWFWQGVLLMIIGGTSSMVLIVMRTNGIP